MNNKFLTGQAVILAAGGSTRFWPLNLKHKSLIKIMGKSLIYHKIKALKSAGVKEIIIVQNKKKEVEEELKNYANPGIKIKYVVQEEPLGTGHALLTCFPFLKERFMFLYGDDWYEKEDFKKCLEKFPSAILKDFPDPSPYSLAITKKDYIKEIIEKPFGIPGNLVSIGCYFIPKEILKEKIEKSLRGEYEATDYIKALIKKEKVYFSKASNWIPLSYSFELSNIAEHLFSEIKTKIEGKIEKNCTIKGPVIIEKEALIKSGSYIEGPVYIGKNSKIGPNCYIRGLTNIGDSCAIGNAVEIKNSIIGDNSFVCHLSYVGDSIIGESCNLGAGTIISNFRFDGAKIRFLVNGKIIDSGKEKLGAVLGDNVKTGVNSSIMPGVLIGTNSIIGPHSLVKENIEDNTIFYTRQEISKKIKSN